MHNIAARLRPALGEPAFFDASCLLYACEHRVLADAMRTAELQVDAMNTDPPYSAETQAGHNAMEAADASGAPRDNRERQTLGIAPTRRGIEYPPWSNRDVEGFVDTWSPLVRGWMLVMTDSQLQRDYRGAFETNGRLDFPPVPCVEKGMTVRMCGGGPSSWTTYAMVARPRSRQWARWPTTPGEYEGPTEPKPRVGGKPVWLVVQQLADYTRPGDLVVDPCCGAATLGVASRGGWDRRRDPVRVEPRCTLLADADPVAVDLAVRRLRGERTKSTRDDFPETDDQPSLFTAARSA